MKRTFYYIFVIALLSLSAIDTHALYWHKITSIPAPYNNNYWLDVFFLPSNPQYGWVCGFNGYVIRTTNGGVTWSGTEIVDADHLESIHFPSATIGYTSGVEGVFKTIDGGATWSSVTPPGAAEIWGCFFADNNNGIAVGGGCGTEQHFWKTTDAGFTWTDVTDNEPNSGLTDVILYSPTGLGYAVSSGRLWITNNGGNSWEIFSESGTNVWQEEITHYNNSFLLPYAGELCTGGGSDGGMRFTVNNGLSWEEYSLGNPMFGTFLINDVTGWACGYNRAVYYTQNAGVSWEERNCGIENGNLDDIWFINSTNGWVVGEGVYQLGQDTQLVTKNYLDFDNVCIPAVKYDTLWFKNYSFSATNVHAEIREDPDNAYTLIRPSPDFRTENCDSQMIVIRFSPQAAGNFTSRLVLTGDNFELSVSLFGNGSVSTVNITDTLIVINPAVVGSTTQGSLKWTATRDNEFVTNINYQSGSADIVNKTSLPLRMTLSGSDLVFAANPRDTGWITTRFKVHLTPCDKDTFITVRAYGVSPIISANNSLDVNLECSNVRFDTIPVRNTGNGQLTIKSAQILNPSSGFAFMGWTSKRNMPIVINTGAADSAIIRFSPPAAGTFNTVLRIVNNDSTRINGRKTPFDILLSGTMAFSYLIARDTVIDFGEVCAGSSMQRTLTIKNTGNLNTNFTYKSLRGMFYELSKTNPVFVRGGDSVSITLTFAPKTVGDFIDTLLIENNSCSQTLKIAVKGNSISGEIVANPGSVSIIVTTAGTYSRTVNVKADGTEPVTINSIDVVPALPGWTYTIDPALPVTLNPGESADFTITFNIANDGNYNGTICIKTTGKCPGEECLPLELALRNENISWSKNVIDFGVIKCSLDDQYDTLTITNIGGSSTQITRLEILPNETTFSIINKPVLPLPLAVGASHDVIIQYHNESEGRFSDTLVFESTSDPDKIFEVPVNGEFRKPIIDPTVIMLDFGTMELCNPKKDTTFTFYNNGSEDEIFNISKSDIPAGLEVFPSDNLIVPAGDSNQITLTFDPSLMSGEGRYDGLVTLTGTVCPVAAEIQVKVKIIKPRFSISPDPLDFGTVESQTVKSGSVLISNIGEVGKTITAMKLANGRGFTLRPRTLPVTLQRLDTIHVDIDFASAEWGTFRDTLIIYSTSDCPDTNFVSLNAIVPEEFNDIIISAGNYLVSPGDTVKVALSLNKAVPKILPERINMEIAFDKMLLLPTGFSVRTEAGFMPVAYDYDYERLTVVIEKPESENLLSDSGIIAYLHGYVLASLPDSTSITIKKFDITSQGNIKVGLIPGSLKITELCTQTLAFRIMWTPGFSAGIVQQVVNSPVLTVAINATDRQRIKASITNLSGTVVSEHTLSSTAGDNKFEMDISKLPQGMYNITLISEYGSIWHGKFVMVK